MLIDARSLDPGTASSLAGDVCIVGGGIAGITIALELARSGIDVVVLESGGIASDAQTDDLHRGESAGVDYDFGFHHRSRFLGGGSNCWSGWSRPLEPEDFARRSWVVDSGWPLSRESLMPYYDRAHTVLGLGPTTYESDYWNDRIQHPRVLRADLDETTVRTSYSQFANVLRFAETYRDELETHPRLTVLLHANLTGIQPSDTGGHVTGVTARTLTGRTVHVSAHQFVLAAGGIENARLLLAAGADLGTDHDLIGRYFMEHPRRLSGEVSLRPEFRRNRLYEVRSQHRSSVVAADGVSAAAALVVSPEVQEQEQLLNARACFRSMYVGEASSAVESMKRLRRLVRHRDGWGPDHTAELVNVARHPWQAAGFVGGRAVPRRPFVRGMQLELIVEPSPERTSRVTLSRDRDALGMPRARVDWRLGDQVRHTFERTAAILAAELERAGVAAVALSAVDVDGWRDEVEATWHHMGTTRMSASPRDGAVDPDCRVHGVSNLFVAGSSVFPTAGANFPTMTLTALALRLAEHLVAIESRSG